MSGSLQGAGGVGGLLQTRLNGTNQFVLSDANGNVTALFSVATRDETARYEYDAFGVLLRATGPLAKINHFRFSTKYTDDETDLVYYGYRYYNPSTGRWLSRDPIGEQGGLNLYGFVGNDPVNRVDTDGLSIFDPINTALDYYSEKGRNAEIWAAIKVAGLAPGLPQKLLRQYIDRKGDLKLTKAEVLELKPVSSLFPIKGSQFTGDQKFLNDLSKCPCSFTGTYTLYSGALLNGTLGQFTTTATVNVKCSRSGAKGENIKFTAKGTANVKDKWDFDWRLYEYLTTGNGRSFFGQIRTMAGSVMTGTPFNITSEDVDVEQTETSYLLFK